MESEIPSEILSGWPSVTDSEVNTWVLEDMEELLGYIFGYPDKRVDREIVNENKQNLLRKGAWPELHGVLL
jgi:hypothetical protein